MKVKFNFFALALLLALQSTGQTLVDFEDLTLSTGTYWYDQSSAQDTFFLSKNTVFPHQYSGYWASGWVYSNVKDSTTAGYTNLAAARAGSGFRSSANYAVGQRGATLRFDDATKRSVAGLYVCNSTYAALSMASGDAFAKKFGGATGTDPDYFLLTVKGYSKGVEINDSVNFYLADYRFSDPAQDYIVKDWTWLDLSSLGAVDSLKFLLSSSDNGQYGMNTPAFFCIDNLEYNSITSDELVERRSDFIYPNPTDGVLYLNLPQDLQLSEVRCYDASGKLVVSKSMEALKGDLKFNLLQSGIYFIQIIHEKGKLTQKVVVR